MNDFQIVDAIKAIEELHSFANSSPQILPTLSDLSQDLELLLHLKENPTGDTGWEQIELLDANQQSGNEFTEEVQRSAWSTAVNGVHRLVRQAELITSSMPGCLPRDEGSCKLMDLVLQLRRSILNGYDFYMNA